MTLHSLQAWTFITIELEEYKKRILRIVENLELRLILVCYNFTDGHKLLRTFMNDLIQNTSKYCHTKQS